MTTSGHGVYGILAVAAAVCLIGGLLWLMVRMYNLVVRVESLRLRREALTGL